MRKMKKLAAIVASTVLAVSMITATTTFTASADPAPTANVSVETGNTNTYMYYQIFTGTFQEDSTTHEPLLMNDGLAVGSGLDAAAFCTDNSIDITGLTDNQIAVAILNKLDGKTSTQVAAALTPYLQNGETLNNATGAVLPYGYYLIKETGSGMTADILTVANSASLTISTKTGKPTVEKKVQEDDRTVTSGGVIGDYDDNDNNTDDDKWNDAADYCIGESVPFRITVKMPDNIAQFDHYYLQIIDYLQKSFTQPENTAYAIKLVEGNGTEHNITSTITTQDDSTYENYHTFFTWNDIIATATGAGVTLTKDCTIVIDYKATLTDTAVIGNLGNTNGVYIVYSTNTTYAGGGYSGEDEPDENPDFGKSTKDGVVVFTYTLTTTKIDADNTSKTLQGAEFVLLNADKSKYAKVDDGKFAGWVDNKADATTLTSDASGKFSVIGLDSGTYYLEEIAAPSAEYNMLDEPVEVVIGADMNSNGSWEYKRNNGTTAFTNLTVTYDSANGTTDNGVASGTIENAKGVKLPETGGIGTKLFYGIGGTLAAGAGVLLITKKRAKKED